MPDKLQAAGYVSAHIASLPDLPAIDHAQYGDVETQPLDRIQAIGGDFLARNWVTIPHVTHHDEADITACEAHRKSVAASACETKPTLPAVLVKALTLTLKQYPKFNASLDSSGKSLVLKHYYNIGVAVDTPAGLLVPVIHNADQKTVVEISGEIADLSERARGKGLPMSAMSGGSFTISSIGVLGGTSFTPIINAPEVAILGVTRSYWKPHRAEGDQVNWRLMLPLSLSYDHRVINGADAARFLTSLAAVLAAPENVEA
ncbi:MAG: 2-oxo acid dehydrogenase subunit E2 [Pseudomonadota bacterium]